MLMRIKMYDFYTIFNWTWALCIKLMVAKLDILDEAFIVCGCTLTSDGIIFHPVGASIHKLAHHIKLIT